MAIRKQCFLETIAALLYNAALMFLVGILTLVAGLAMILAHNVPSGGISTVVVTVVGWIALMKGLLFLLLPEEVEADLFLRKLHYAQYCYVFLAISLVIGVYLTYDGFVSRSHS